MTVTTQGKVGAYKTNQSGGASEREIEARALLTAAGRLSMAINSDNPDMTTYTEAIRSNQHLWTIFQVAICDPDNPLPKDLKNIILNLSHYVDKVSFEAVSRFAPDLLTSLININRMIATGLSKRATTIEHVVTPAAGAISNQMQPTSLTTSA